MSNIDEMRRLKEEILTSFDERLNSIKAIVKSNNDSAQSTHDMLHQFRDEHFAMSTSLKQKLNELKTNLADENRKRFNETQEEIKQRVNELSSLFAAFKGDGESDFSHAVAELLQNFRSVRLNEFDRFMTGLQQRIASNKTDVASELEQFQEQHQRRSNDMKQMLNSFRADLAEFKKRLSLQESERFSLAAKEIDERVNYLNSLFRNSKAMIDNFKEDHAAMAKILKETITFKGFNAERLQNFNESMARIHENQQKQRHEIAGMLADFHETHEAMRLQLFTMLSGLKTNLTQGNADRIRLAQEELTNRLASLNAMKAEVTTLLDRVQSESQEAIQEWQNIARVIQGKRSGETIQSSDENSTRDDIPVVQENVSSKHVETSDNGAEEKILAWIQEHGANGMKLKDISQAMNLTWQKLIPYTKALVEKELIRKQDTLYFPK